MEVYVSRKMELHDFVSTAWPKRHGDAGTLMGWVEKAFLAYPDVDLLTEARKASLWEAERPSNTKRSIRRFLSNWWSKSQSKEPGRRARVVSIGAVRWLKKNNKSPDYAFENWVRGREVTPEAVLEFCSYASTTEPFSPEEVVTIFLEGV